MARLLEIVSGLCQDRAEISVLEKTLRAVANLCGGNPSVSRAALSKSCFTILGKCGDVSAKLTPSSAEALACAIGTVSQTLCSASAAAADGSRDAGASASTSAAAETDLPGQRLSRAALLHLLDMFAQEAPTVETCARALVRFGGSLARLTPACCACPYPRSVAHDVSFPNPPPSRAICTSTATGLPRISIPRG